MWAPQHMRKIFVGGIDYTTTDETLKSHFSNMGRFGFVTFVSPDHVDAAQKARPHKVDGRLVETKRAVPRSDGNTSLIPLPNHPDATHTRIFIGGLPQDVKEDDLENYFALFGSVTCVNIMYDKSSGLTRNHIIKGRPIDVKKAISKSDIGKLKALMSGVVTPETAALALGSNLNTMTNNILQKNVNNMQGLPVVNMNSNNENGNNGNPAVTAGPSTSTQNSNLTNGNNINTNIPGGILPGMIPPFGPLGHPFLQRLNLSHIPGFSAQLRSGWQYSVSSNAEVLRNTAGALCSEPSGAPAIAGIMPPIPGTTDSDGESDVSLEEQVMETDDGMLSTSPSGGISEAWKITRSEDKWSPNAIVLILEPFYGGSHKQLIVTLQSDESLFSPDDLSLFILPSKKWHWKARTSALYFYQKIPQEHNLRVLFASSTLNLCELVSLRPDLAALKKILYFHENQLVYPIRKEKHRDFHLVADQIVFNSQYNLESFLREIPRHIKRQPGLRPDPGPIVEVLYFPVSITHKTRSPKDALEPLHIIWPHREHDKDPDTFFQVLYQLTEAGLNFRLSVLGESFAEAPPVFAEARVKLSNFIHHWGYAENKEKIACIIPHNSYKRVWHSGAQDHNWYDQRKLIWISITFLGKLYAHREKENV
ncbi:Glycosyltransferase-like domain-containing protein 1-like [Armadillidium vulgare]|nr:Glycosyltransferase-like domain-containing protein 1-like [Armadillidium vulgare]